MKIDQYLKILFSLMFIEKLIYLYPQETPLFGL